MITGDRSATVFAIARELHLNHGVLEAGQIAGLRSDLLAPRAAQPQVFASVAWWRQIGCSLWSESLNASLTMAPIVFVSEGALATRSGSIKR
jgi:hypothetical protein